MILLLRGWLVTGTKVTAVLMVDIVLACIRDLLLLVQAQQLLMQEQAAGGLAAGTEEGVCGVFVGEP